MCKLAAYNEVYSQFGIRATANRPKSVDEAKKFGLQRRLQMISVKGIAIDLKSIKKADPKGHHLAATFVESGALPQSVKDLESLASALRHGLNHDQDEVMPTAIVDNIGNDLRRIKKDDPEGHEIAAALVRSAWPPRAVDNLELQAAL